MALLDETPKFLAAAYFCYAIMHAGDLLAAKVQQLAQSEMVKENMPPFLLTAGLALFAAAALAAVKQSWPRGPTMSKES